MKREPFFTVVIPTYNRAIQLPTTLSTVLRQTFHDYTVLIVDDGSTDNTSDVLKNFHECKTIKQTNRERGAARNTGFLNADGKYVVFFDSDDIMHPNHLQVLHDHILQNNFPDFISTKFDFTNESGSHRDSDMAGLRQGFYDYRLFLNGNPIACNVCVRRANKAIHPFEEDRRYAIKEDWMYLIQNLKKSRLFIVDNTTISMLDHPDRSMRSGNKPIIEKTLLAKKWINDHVDLTPSEIKQLEAHVNYFCAIHAYLDRDRTGGLTFIRRALLNGGIRLKYLVLALKLIIGASIIRRGK